jgi:hypothetical protein
LRRGLCSRDGFAFMEGLRRDAAHSILHIRNSIPLSQFTQAVFYNVQTHMSVRNFVPAYKKFLALLLETNYSKLGFTFNRPSMYPIRLQPMGPNHGSWDSSNANDAALTLSRMIIQILMEGAYLTTSSGCTRGLHRKHGPSLSAGKTAGMLP